MYELTGKVKTVVELQTFASGFTKRELVVEKAAELKSKLWTVRSGVETPEGVERFVAAQEGVWEIVLPELRAGEKRGHWMWYIFPQIIGLGSSSMSKRYAIRNLAEAREYLAHPVLGTRLREAMSVLLAHRGRKSAREIFSDIDAVKLRSCVTLFDIVSPGGVFADILDAFYYGKPCARTLSILKSRGEAEVSG